MPSVPHPDLSRTFTALLFASLLLIGVPARAGDVVAGVVLDWDFEGGVPGAPVRTATDRSGLGNHGVTVLGEPILVETPLDADGGGLGMRVQGEGLFGSGLVAAESPSLNLALQDAFTVEVIFRPVGDNGRANRTLVQRSDPGTLIWSYGLYYDGDRGQANFGVSGADGRHLLVYSDVPADGRFHRLAGVFNHGIVSLFVDGVLRTNAFTSIAPDPRSKRGVSVGAIFNGGYYFNGEFARVRLTSRALEASELLTSGEPSFEGIAISWWVRWFGTDWATDPRATADADPDSDGSSNRVEYGARTDPLDPDSGFLRKISVAPRLEWRTVPGGVYLVERRLSLGSPDRVAVSPELTATSTNLVFIDDPSLFPLSFYEIRRVR